MNNKFDELVESILSEKKITAYLVVNDEDATMGVFKTEDDAKLFQDNAMFGYYKGKTKIVPTDGKYAHYDDPKKHVYKESIKKTDKSGREYWTLSNVDIDKELKDLGFKDGVLKKGKATIKVTMGKGRGPGEEIAVRSQIPEFGMTRDDIRGFKNYGQAVKYIMELIDTL